jgi:hypothetical protein
MGRLSRRIAYAVKRILPSYWPSHSKYHSRPRQPRVAYVVATPRTGSTLAKRYLGEHPALCVARNAPYRHAWRLARRVHPKQIVIDKRTDNLDKIQNIHFDYGNWAWFAAIVRDPRDQLVSLLETDRHFEVPRTLEYWTYWYAKYERLFAFAREHLGTGLGICLVRYEDLVRDPIRIKQQFLKWLGVDVEPRELSATYRNTVAEIAAGVDVTEDWKTHQQNEVHQESVGRWRSVTQLKHARLMAYHRELPEVDRLMKALGYGDRTLAVKAHFGGIVLLGRTAGDAMEFRRAA